MIFTITLTVLICLELLLVSMVAAIYFYWRYRSESEHHKDITQQLEDLQSEIDVNALTISNFARQFSRIAQQQLEISPYTRSKQDNLLHKRYQFIEAELNALLDQENGEEYWNSLCDRLANLLPTHLFPNENVNESDLAGMAEIPDLQNELLAADNTGSIPTLDSEVALNPVVKSTMAYVTLNPLQNEIKRLKRVIGRHFGLIGDIKVALTNRTNGGENNIPKLLKELQITHVQFSRSLKALTQENARLAKLLTSTGSITGNSSSVLDINKQRAIKPLKEPAKSKKRRTQGRG